MTSLHDATRGLGSIFRLFGDSPALFSLGVGCFCLEPMAKGATTRGVGCWEIVMSRITSALASSTAWQVQQRRHGFADICRRVSGPFPGTTILRACPCSAAGADPAVRLPWAAARSRGSQASWNAKTDVERRELDECPFETAGFTQHKRNKQTKPKKKKKG